MLEKIKKLFGLKSSKNEAHEMYMNLMNTKQVYSIYSDKLVTFMDFSVKYGAWSEGDEFLENIRTLVADRVGEE